MGEETGISWTNATWNPWHGCEKVSAGCKNCYMFREKKQYGQDPTKVVRSKTKFDDPLKWVSKASQSLHQSIRAGVPKYCFTCSWSDFFIEQADPWRSEAWDIIKATPEITYQILTKRPERIAMALPDDWGTGYSNVWLGVSCENQAAADERIPLLINTPAAVRFISAEPLLGPINLDGGLRVAWQCSGCRAHFSGALQRVCPCCGRENYWTGSHAFNPRGGQVGSGIDWVIVGGESGPGARPMHPDWARSLRDQCLAAGVAFHFKQWGEYVSVSEIAGVGAHHIFSDGATVRRVGTKNAGATLDGREWQEFPAVAR